MSGHIHNERRVRYKSHNTANKPTRIPPTASTNTPSLLRPTQPRAQTTKASRSPLQENPQNKQTNVSTSPQSGAEGIERGATYAASGRTGPRRGSGGASRRGTCRARTRARGTPRRPGRRGAARRSGTARGGTPAAPALEPEPEGAVAGWAGAAEEAARGAAGAAAGARGPAWGAGGCGRRSTGRAR